MAGAVTALTDNERRMSRGSVAVWTVNDTDEVTTEHAVLRTLVWVAHYARSQGVDPYNVFTQALLGYHETIEREKAQA